MTNEVFLLWPNDTSILVSNFGRIFSNKNGDWYELRQSQTKDGYFRVGVGHSNPKFVHRLVAETFVENPYSKLEVNHIDGNKQNNIVTNLEWTTRRENMQHAVNHGFHKPKGTSIRIVETNVEYASISECARDIGGDQRNISLCLAGKRRTCMGYHFERVANDNN